MAPHLTPASDDPAFEFRAKLAADRRRTRNKVVAVLGVVVLLAIAALIASWYFDAERVIAAERPRTDAIKAQYCKILEAENARLKRLVADQALDNQILREAARPNW